MKSIINFKKIAENYKIVAVHLVSTTILFIFVNLFLLGVVQAVKFSKHWREYLGPIHNNYLMDNAETMLRLYPGFAISELDKMSSEYDKRSMEYAPFSLYREKAMAGTYVNISSHGFRQNGPAANPWPPQEDSLAVFVFGGSTTFGYGAPDAFTITAYLEKDLRERVLDKKIFVYNFGRGGFFSSQEREVFISLLLEGIVPDIAVFIDGTNEFMDFAVNNEPDYARELQGFFRGEYQSFNYYVRSLVQMLPAYQACYFLKEWVTNRSELEPRGDYAKDAELCIRRFYRNTVLIEAIAKTTDTKTLFVWQPVPEYKYDLRYLGLSLEIPYSRRTEGYRIFGKKFNKGINFSDFLWLADMQQGLKEPLYMDGMHYGPQMNHKIASAITRTLLERRMI